MEVSTVILMTGKIIEGARISVLKAVVIKNKVFRDVMSYCITIHLLVNMP